VLVRDASDDDQWAIVRVAGEYGHEGADSVMNPRYVDYLRREGRLLVSEQAGEVVAFAGGLRLGETLMVSELFVSAEHHARGIGTAMLNALVGDHRRIMTFSSPHPAARAAYERIGMQPLWRLRYLAGPVVHRRSAVQATRVEPNAFVIDRPEMLRVFEPVACVGLDRDRKRVGSAIVADPDGEPVVHRLLLAEPHADAMLAIMNLLPVGTTLRVRVPDWSDACHTLQEVGFSETDHDMFMATTPSLLSRSLEAVNPGLA
jgi:GNAT superfamily N-acetyltransferase